MHILFFNRSFYPDIEATGQFLGELCEDLEKYGHTVTVVAGKPYHPKENLINFFIEIEKHNSIKVIRARGTKLPKNILLLRFINLGTYFLLAFVGGFLVDKKPDVVIAKTDPPVLGLLGIFFSKFYKAKFIYSCEDIYPDVGIVTRKLTSPFLNFLLSKINLFSFLCADKIICLGEDMKRKIVSKGVSDEKIDIIHNWADTTFLSPVPKNGNSFFIVMYSGNIGLTQGLEKIVEVADDFKSRKRKNVKFIFIGDGANKANLQRQVDLLSLENVTFLPYEDKSKLRYSLGSCDVHLISLQKGLAGIVVPSKVYGILACGKPFIAWVDEESEISSIAKRFKCGITIPPGDIKKMIDTIEWATQHPGELKEMGENGRRAAVECFDRKISTSKFNQLILEISK